MASRNAVVPRRESSMPNVNATSRVVTDDAALRLLRLIEQLVAESHPQREITVTLDSSFERDLGLDSLARRSEERRVGKECRL